jgi:hypothetical protein
MGPETRNARALVKSSILADHRRLDALAGAKQVDRLLQEVADALLGGDQDKAPPPSVTRQHCNSRNGQAILREFRTSSTEIGVRNVALGFFAARRQSTSAAPFAN